MGETPPPGTKRPYSENAPFERPEDGCPGAWVHSPFIVALCPYLRPRTAGHVRVDNLRLTPDLWWVIREAVAEYEYFEDLRISDEIHQENMAADKRASTQAALSKGHNY